jgi:hypothetical protein
MTKTFYNNPPYLQRRINGRLVTLVLEVRAVGIGIIFGCRSLPRQGASYFVLKQSNQNSSQSEGFFAALGLCPAKRGLWVHKSYRGPASFSLISAEAFLLSGLGVEDGFSLGVCGLLCIM